MNFHEAKLPGAFVIEAEPAKDERGSFSRFWCAREYREHGLNPTLAQCSVSRNPTRGTLRGMHYQVEPWREAKTVCVVRGEIYDVIVDLRPDSGTFKQWTAVGLSSDAATMLYVPEGFAHGFQTLADDTEIVYLISQFHEPTAARGIRWNDPAFGIEWPIPEPVLISERDASYEDFVLP